MIIQYGNYNNFSKETLKDPAFTLKPGEKAFFKLNGIVPDPNPRNRGRFLGPSVRYISNRMMVRDPHSGEGVDMYMIHSINPDGVIVPKRPAFTANNMWTISLYGDNPDDVDLFFYLMMSDECENKPNRNIRVEPVYYFVDDKSTAKNINELIDKRYKAIELANKLSENDLEDFARILRYDVKDHELIRVYLKQLADESPDTFLAVYNDKYREIKLLILEAMDKEVLFYLPHEHKFVYNDGTTLFSMPFDPNGKHVQYLTDFIISHPDGKDCIRAIQAMLLQKDAGNKVVQKVRQKADKT